MAAIEDFPLAGTHKRIRPPKPVQPAQMLDVIGVQPGQV
jgi:hypothetical protein